MRIVLMTACLLLATACERNLSPDTYSSDATIGKVLRGTVLSSRIVTVKNHDTLTGNGTGILAGGVAGGVAGSTIGKGNGSTVAAVGGAIAGAVIGALVEDQLGTDTAAEYIVQLDRAKDAPTRKKEQRSISDRDSITADIKQSINVAETETDVISVIQSPEPALAVGQRVLVIYHEDRPRLVAER